MDDQGNEDSRLTKTPASSKDMVEACKSEEIAKTPFGLGECQTFIVEDLGQDERIPARYNIHEGTKYMLGELEKRYGSQYQESFINLLENHLRNEYGTSQADKALWRAWRADFRITGTFSTPGVNGSHRARVLSWNSGDEERLAHIHHTARSSRRSSSSYLAEGMEREYENRVDLANDSKPATDLFEEPSRLQKCAQKLLSPWWKPRRCCQKQTPWEEKEYLASGRH